MSDYVIEIILQKWLKYLQTVEQWRPWSDTSCYSIWSGSALFASYFFMVSRLKWVMKTFWVVIGILSLRQFQWLPACVLGEIKNKSMHLKSLLSTAKTLWSVAFINALSPSTMGKSFSRQHFKIFFIRSPKKQVLTFHAECLHWRQFAWNVKTCFLGKRKISVCCLLN